MDDEGRKVYEDKALELFDDYKVRAFPRLCAENE